MTQQLTVIRLGSNWAVRDVTGAVYGVTPVLAEASETAQGMAQRTGGRMILSDEAKAAGMAVAAVPENAEGQRNNSWLSSLLSRWGRR